jgi:hypothetical protein
MDKNYYAKYRKELVLKNVNVNTWPPKDINFQFISTVLSMFTSVCKF